MIRRTLAVVVITAVLSLPARAQSAPSDSTCIAMVSSPKNAVLAKLLCVPERVRVDTVIKVHTDTLLVPTKPDTVLVPTKPDTVFVPSPPDTVFVPIDTTTPPPPPPPPAVDTTVLGKIGPTLSPAQAKALGGGYAMFDSLFAKWEPVRRADGVTWGAANYYDRALIYYAMWRRTGNALYRQRADSIALNYRRTYLHASNYQTSPHWAQLDGVAIHYLLTGDDSSRIAVGKAAWNLAGTALWPKTNPYNDARTQARAFTGMLLAWQINAPNAPTGGWAKAIDDGLNNVLSQQMADGGWRYANTCNLSLNYMSAMLSDALIRLHEKYRPDARIPGAVQKTADFLWTQWRAADSVPSFNYYEALCVNQHGTGGQTATQDLSGLFTTTYAWMARRDPAYLQKSRDVFTVPIRQQAVQPGVHIQLESVRLPAVSHAISQLDLNRSAIGRAVLIYRSRIAMARPMYTFSASTSSSRPEARTVPLPVATGPATSTMIAFAPRRSAFRRRAPTIASRRTVILYSTST
jgi:hypothetical protein